MRAGSWNAEKLNKLRVRILEKVPMRQIAAELESSPDLCRDMAARHGFLQPQNRAARDWCRAMDVISKKEFNAGIANGQIGIS